MTMNEFNEPGIKQSKRNSSTSQFHWEQYALASGLGFIVLFFIAGMMGPESPGATVPATQLAEWYRQYHDISLAQVYVRGVAAFAMLFFVAGIGSLIHRAEGRVNTLSLIDVAAASQ